MAFGETGLEFSLWEFEDVKCLLLILYRSKPLVGEDGHDFIINRCFSCIKVFFYHSRSLGVENGHE